MSSYQDWGTTYTAWFHRTGLLWKARSLQSQEADNILPHLIDQVIFCLVHQQEQITTGSPPSSSPMYVQGSQLQCCDNNNRLGNFWESARYTMPLSLFEFTSKNMKDRKLVSFQWKKYVAPESQWRSGKDGQWCRHSNLQQNWMSKNLKVWRNNGSKH